MSTQRKTMVLLWALGAASGLSWSVLSILAAQDGHLTTWGLVSFGWSAAMLAGLAHRLGAEDALTRYRLRHKPLAGPRDGAQLPS